jgi:hypothetical protein
MSAAPNSEWMETYKSLVTLSTEGFKLSALINGGAAVALLAYLGNVAGKEKAVPDLRAAMFAFLTGLGLCAFSILFAYLTQLKRLNDLAANRDPSKSWRLSVAISLFIGSLIAFIVGSILAVISFK